MDWRGIPLAGLRPVSVALLVVVVGVVLLEIARRQSWGRPPRLAGLVIAGVGGVATVAVVANSALGAYPTAGDVVPRPRPQNIGRVHPTSGIQLEQGTDALMQVPDTQSHFGSFEAYLWVPPQYFTEPQRRFPVVILTHGNPGTSSDWLQHGSAAEIGLASARAGHPVILVMPTVLQSPNGDSLCVNTESQGNAETYVVRDVVAAADSQLRTIPDAQHRAIGGFSMGGFCALNLGLKHPDVFSVVLSFDALTVCEPDAIDGGNEALFGTPDWQEQVLDNSPAEYYQDLDPAKGPALWLDVGEDEPQLEEPLETLASNLSAKGFTVQFHSRPGGHDFQTWSAALRDSLPWAAARLG